MVNEGRLQAKLVQIRRNGLSWCEAVFLAHVLFGTNISMQHWQGVSVVDNICTVILIFIWIRTFSQEWEIHEPAKEAVLLHALARLSSILTA